MSEPRLVATGLGKRWGAMQALTDVSLTAGRGEVHALIGENGAGKSTLMNILSGAVVADAGTMLLDGFLFVPRAPKEARDAGVTIVHQELALCPHLTVYENVVLGAEPGRGILFDRSAAIARTESALAGLLGDASRIDPRVPVASLSIADRQLVEIARAVAGPVEPRVVLFDEPTSSIGRTDVERLFALIRGLAARGVTVLYVSHFLEEVREVCDRFTILRDGAVVSAGAIATTETEAIVHAMAGRKVETLFPRSERVAPNERGRVALTATDVRGRTKPTRASLELRYGEVFGIAGLVGAGRTELLRALAGLDPMTAGTVTPHARIGMLSEDRRHEGLALTLSIADNITMSDHGFWAWPAKALARTRSWIADLQIRARGPEQPVSELSGGNQQKVLFGRLLQSGAEVVFLDEPTRGVDVQSKMQIYRLIDDLAQQKKAVLVVSSYVPELLGVCDRIAVMFRGELGAAKPVNEWTEQSILAEATGAA